MSHFTVLVIGDNPEDQLAPFQENNMDDCPRQFLKFNEDKECNIDPETGKRGYWENPNAKWDWYSLGGRWAGFFRLKPGKGGIQGHHRAKDFAAIDGRTIEDLPAVQVDQCLKGDIDIEGMRLEAKAESIVTYQKFLTALDGLPLPPKWDSFRESFGENIDEARRQYWANESCQALRRSDFFDWDDLLDGEEIYVQDRVNSCISTHAVIKDGKWYECGEMGWFAFVHNEKGHDQWLSEYSKLFDSIPDDTLVSVFDCHI